MHIMSELIKLLPLKLIALLKFQGNYISIGKLTSVLIGNLKKLLKAIPEKMNNAANTAMLTTIIILSFFISINTSQF